MNFRGPLLPLDACYEDGGCRYLRELSTLERLSGGQPTAEFHEALATRCLREGCWALLLHLHKASSPPSRRQRFPRRATGLAQKPKAAGGRRAGAAVIPFARRDVADMVSDEAGDFVERRPLGLGTLDRSEPLGHMYDYWRWLRSTTKCQLLNVDAVHVVRADIVGKLHVVDVASADPDDFRFELFGYGIPMEPCEKPRSSHATVYADSVLRDYNTVRLTAAPRLQRVRVRIGRVFHHYTRLILPLFDTRRQVSRLLVAVRQEQDDATTLT